VSGEGGAPTARRATRERHDRLVALVRSGVDGVETLARELGVSASTVRRDLGQLQRGGRLARTYGGAIVREDFEERSFGESEHVRPEAKARIGAEAARRVLPGSTVFVDAGTTCLALARRLTVAGPLTVVTRGLEAALLLARADDVSVEMLGGSVRPLSHGVVGPHSSLALARMRFDVAFLGADVVDPERGVGEPTAEETWVKEQAAGRADRVVLLADSSKVAAAPLPAWLPFGEHWSMVTDGDASPASVAALTRAGLDVTLAG
jgi:DeoR/GlpR family transcriptional regulator of sugar metabolism